MRYLVTIEYTRGPENIMELARFHYYVEALRYMNDKAREIDLQKNTLKLTDVFTNELVKRL